jgi:hypothetical protein
MRAPWMLSVATIAVLTVLAGCQMPGKTESAGARWPATTNPALELDRDPTILLTRRQDWPQMTLHGLRIGDDESRIPKSKMAAPKGAGGWIVLRDANRYRIADGKIDALGVWDQKLLGKLGIGSQDQIATKFGTPDETLKVTTDITIYQYQSGHIHVMWHRLENRVTGVNVTR